MEELCADLVISIAKKVVDCEDFTSFRGVCKFWRTVATKDVFHEKTRISLLCPAIEGQSVSCEYPFRNILRVIRARESRIKAIKTVLGVGFGWILIVDSHGSVSLRNPDSGITRNLPNLNSYPRVPSSYPQFTIQTKPAFIERAALSADPTHQPWNSRLAVLVHMNKLGYWTPGSDSWTHISQARPGHTVKNLCYVSGTLYLVGYDVPTRRVEIGTANERLMSFDSEETLFFDGPLNPVSLYILKSTEGGLLVIIRHRKMQCTRKFQLISIDLEAGNCKEIKELAGDALFIGNNSAIAVPVPLPSPVFKPNCIYFTDDNVSSTTRGKDTGVCDLAAEEIELFDISTASRSYPPPLWLDALFKE